MGSVRDILSSRFKKAVVSVVAIALISGASAYAYFSTLPPQLGPRVSTLSSPVELSLALDKSEYLLGENMTVTFLLRNTSNQTIIVGWPTMIGAGDNVVSESGGVYDWTPSVVPPQPDSTFKTRNLFHFVLTVLNENETTILEMGNYGWGGQTTYELRFEPSGYIRQTLTLALQRYSAEDPFPIEGALRIMAMLYHVGIASLGSITLETPSITFTIR